MKINRREKIFATVYTKLHNDPKRTKTTQNESKRPKRRPKLTQNNPKNPKRSKKEPKMTQNEPKQPKTSQNNLRGDLK